MMLDEDLLKPFHRGLLPLKIFFLSLESVKTPFRRRIEMPSRAGCFMLFPFSLPSITMLPPRVQTYHFNSLVGVGVRLIEIFGVHEEIEICLSFPPLQNTNNL